MSMALAAVLRPLADRAAMKPVPAASASAKRPAAAPVKSQARISGTSVWTLGFVSLLMDISSEGIGGLRFRLRLHLFRSLHGLLGRNNIHRDRLRSYRTERMHIGEHQDHCQK